MFNIEILMHISANILLSVVESIIMLIYGTFFLILQQLSSEGFTSNSKLSDYPVSDVQGMAYASYEKYRPYLNKTQDPSRAQIDNHKWPSRNEVNGSLEQLLSHNIVLPCNYPIPHLKDTVVKYSEI